MEHLLGQFFLQVACGQVSNKCPKRESHPKSPQVETSLHGPKIVPSFWAPNFADKGEAQQLGFTFVCEFLGPYSGQQKGAKKY